MIQNICLCIFVIFICPTYLFSQEKVIIEGAIEIGTTNNTSPAEGTIRWSGTDFEGYNGQRWVSLTGNATIGSVMDVDGNSYTTVRIGNQEWMAENLRVSKYNDNMTIPEETDNVAWSELTTGAWCWYNNDSNNELIYGKFYNWHAVNTAKLCPSGWHVASDEEWTILSDYLGGLPIAGGKMKQAGTVLWQSPNTGASNESGFNGLPTGFRNITGVFFNIGLNAYWWTSTESTFNTDWANYRTISNTGENLSRLSFEKTYGYSVRCIKD